MEPLVLVFSAWLGRVIIQSADKVMLVLKKSRSPRDEGETRGKMCEILGTTLLRWTRILDTRAMGRAISNERGQNVHPALENLLVSPNFVRSPSPPFYILSYHLTAIHTHLMSQAQELGLQRATVGDEKARSRDLKVVAASVLYEVFHIAIRSISHHPLSPPLAPNHKYAAGPIGNNLLPLARVKILILPRHLTHNELFLR